MYVNKHRVCFRGNVHVSMQVLVCAPMFMCVCTCVYPFVCAGICGCWRMTLESFSISVCLLLLRTRACWLASDLLSSSSLPFLCPVLGLTDCWYSGSKFRLSCHVAGTLLSEPSPQHSISLYVDYNL